MEWPLHTRAVLRAMMNHLRVKMCVCGGGGAGAHVGHTVVQKGELMYWGPSIVNATYDTCLGEHRCYEDLESRQCAQVISRVNMHKRGSAHIHTSHPVQQRRDPPPATLITHHTYTHWPPG
jgi:hypothetical protein